MNLHRYSNAEEQSSELAQQIAGALQQVLAHQPQATLAVSGGKSPIKLFEKLSHQQLPWERVTITLVDERFLPVNHPDSNENLVRQHLLINNAEVAHFIGLYSDQDVLFSVNNANLHIKKIDVAILGMGEDGHTASIFPCCDELKMAVDTQLTPERYIITNPKTANYQRIGLSLAGILEIKHIFIAINGDKKLPIIEEAAKAPNLLYPISFVLANRQDSQIYWHA